MANDSLTPSDASSTPLPPPDEKNENQREFLKFQLLCERLRLSPVGVSHLVANLRSDVSGLIGQNANDIGFDAEFSGREFDLIFTFADPRHGEFKGKR